MSPELTKLVLESNLLNFIVLALVLVWALSKFIPKATKQHSELIRREIKEAEDARKLAESKLAELESKLRESKEAARQFLEEAKETARKIKVQVLDDTKVEIQQMKELAEKDLELQKCIILQSIKQKVIEAAFKLTEESVKSETNRQLIEASIRADLEKNLGALEV